MNLKELRSLLNYTLHRALYSAWILKYMDSVFLKSYLFVLRSWYLLIHIYPGTDGRWMETDSEEPSASDTTAGNKILGVFIIITNEQSFIC